MFLLFVSISFVSAAGNSSNDNFIIDVTHDEIKRDSNVTINISVKNKDGTPASGADVEILIDYENGDFVTSHASNLGSNGKYSYVWEIGNVADVGRYDLKIIVRNASHMTIYTDNLHLTIIHTLDVITSKKTVFEGEHTLISVYSKVDGKKNSWGYILWNIDGKNYLTNFKDGVSSISFNSHKIGNNLIYLVYVPPSDMPFFDVIPVVSKSLTINVKGAPDLVIDKIVRSGNKYKITILNVGNGASTKTKLKLWYSKKKYKVVTVAALGAGKSKTYTVKFFKYSTHKKYKKYAQINYNKTAYEKDYTNNKLGFKSNVAYGYAADLCITKVTRSGNNYIVTIKNNGKVAASPFQLKFWFGTKTKAKGLVTYTISKFGQFGKKLPPTNSITLTIPYYPYKTHSKYYKFVSVNANKKVPESNYANNLKKFKV